MQKIIETDSVKRFIDYMSVEDKHKMNLTDASQLEMPNTQWNTFFVHREIESDLTVETGFIWLYKDLNHRVATIQMLFVKEDYRKRRVATKLYNYVENYVFKCLAFRKLLVSTHGSCTEAIKFYNDIMKTYSKKTYKVEKHIFSDHVISLGKPENLIQYGIIKNNRVKV